MSVPITWQFGTWVTDDLGWYLVIMSNGDVLTKYSLTRRHAPFIRADSLKRWGFTTEQIKMVKQEGRKQWEDWKTFTLIVSGARV